MSTAKCTMCLFFKYIKKEVAKPFIYITAFIIGFMINLLMTGSVFTSIVPYFLPLLVQIFSRASITFLNRHNENLSALPKNREDPTFIMDLDGEIINSLGITKELFNSYKINNITQFLSETHALKIINSLKESHGNISTFEGYSELTNKWYDIRYKKLSFMDDVEILVWMDNINDRKNIEKDINTLLSFSSNTITNLKEIIKNHNVRDRLATLIIESGFQGVFIADVDDNYNLSGKVYKSENEVVINSEMIKIDKESSSPILISRHVSKVVSASMDECSTAEAFNKKFSFNKEVKDFLNFDIFNFINYHEKEFSIIAFNKKEGLNKYDDLFMETVVNNTRSIISLIDLAEENESQFVRQVIGLCAAAEYSDEITGKHILRVNEYSKFVAQKLELDTEFVETVYQVAALHDIGKVAIPALIKLDRVYTAEERLMMQMHTIYGAQIIQTMMKSSNKKDSKLQMAYNIALHHHQSFIGTGYPGLKIDDNLIEPVSKDFNSYKNLKPLKENEIPIEALIVSLADTYDALRSKRQYKPEFSHEKTYEILKKDDRSGITGQDRFSSKIWNVFEEYDNIFDEIFERMRG